MQHFSEDVSFLFEDTELSFSFKDFLAERFKTLLPGDEEEKHKMKDEVFKHLDNAYKTVGGMSAGGFHSADQLVKELPLWKIGRKNGKIHSIALYKDKSGRKLSLAGTDGSEEGKKALGNTLSTDLKKNRAKLELSKKALGFVKRHVDLKQHAMTYDEAKAYHKENGGHEVSKPSHDDPEVLAHPELKDHFYVRSIGGHNHTKIMLGK